MLPLGSSAFQRRETTRVLEEEGFDSVTTAVILTFQTGPDSGIMLRITIAVLRSLGSLRELMLMLCDENKA